MLHGEILARRFQGRRTVRLWTDDPAGVAAVIDRIGHVPLPPYIKRDDRPGDRERYQTVYAAERGSIAAPTAGLHFTDDQLAALEAAGVEQVRVTLHVGYGTFKPVRVERVEEHEVDPERYSVSRGHRVGAHTGAPRRAAHHRGRHDDRAGAGVARRVARRRRAGGLAARRACSSTPATSSASWTA